MSPRKQSMHIANARADGLKSWYSELQEYNHPDEIKILLNKYINKDKIESIGDILKLKESMKLDNVSTMGYTKEL